MKKEEESFSDIVNWIAPGIRLKDYLGTLDDEAAEELREAIEEERDRRRETRAVRRNRIGVELSGDETSSEQ